MPNIPNIPADAGSGFNVRNPEIERLLRELGFRLKKDMPDGWGFSLFLFDYTHAADADHGSMFYISTAPREDVIQTLKKFIARNEQ